MLQVPSYTSEDAASYSKQQGHFTDKLIEAKVVKAVTDMKLNMTAGNKLISITTI
jgi:hypothetical protein